MVSVFLVFFLSISNSDYIDICTPGTSLAFPTYPNGFFYLSLGLFDCTGVSIATSGIPLSISLVPSGSLGGPSTLSTSSNGCITTSTDIYAISAGTFQLSVSSPEYTSFLSDQFTVLPLGPSTFSLSSSIKTPTVNFLFALTASLQNSDGSTYTGDSSVTISSPNLAGSLSGYNTLLGTVIFYVYFTANGDFTISATCSSSTISSSQSISAEIIMTVLKQRLEIRLLTPEVSYS